MRDGERETVKQIYYDIKELKSLELLKSRKLERARSGKEFQECEREDSFHRLGVDGEGRCEMEHKNMGTRREREHKFYSLFGCSFGV